MHSNPLIFQSVRSRMRVEMHTYFYSLNKVHINVSKSTYNFVYCLKAWIIKYAEWTYLKQMASLSLVSIGLLQFVVYFTILGLNRSCISSKHARDIRKYLKKRSSCDWSSTQRRWYSPNRSLFSLISCIHHRLLFLLQLSANIRRSSSSSELDIMN
jgi:hypothetical protein